MMAGMWTASCSGTTLRWPWASIIRDTCGPITAAAMENTADAMPATAYEPRSAETKSTAPTPDMDICIRATRPAAEKRAAPGRLRTCRYGPNTGHSHR